MGRGGGKARRRVRLRPLRGRRGPCGGQRCLSRSREGSVPSRVSSVYMVGGEGAGRGGEHTVLESIGFRITLECVCGCLFCWTLLLTIPETTLARRAGAGAGVLGGAGAGTRAGRSSRPAAGTGAQSLFSHQADDFRPALTAVRASSSDAFHTSVPI